MNKKNNNLHSSRDLLKLKNVGKAVLEDLRLLGIHSVEQLKDENPDRLFKKLEEITHKKQNPCVWDVFAAIIHQVRTGQALPWWYFTQLRKSNSNL